MVPVNSTGIAWVLVLAAGINSCIGNLLLKRSRLGITDTNLVNLLFSPWFIGGLIFYGINVVLFAKALEKLPVSVAYPTLAGFGFALLVISAGWFFGERLGLNQYIGLGMILAGIIIMSRP
ncbi:MAG: SMR family transporter [Cyanobacteria bacterium P01_H01_bin.35]